MQRIVHVLVVASVFSMVFVPASTAVAGETGWRSWLPWGNSAAPKTLATPEPVSASASPESKLAEVREKRRENKEQRKSSQFVLESSNKEACKWEQCLEKNPDNILVFTGEDDEPETVSPHVAKFHMSASRFAASTAELRIGLLEEEDAELKILERQYRRKSLLNQTRDLSVDITRLREKVPSPILNPRLESQVTGR